MSRCSSSAPVRLRRACLACATLAAALSFALPALSQDCGFRQLTFNLDYWDWVLSPSVSADGRRSVFLSDFDLVGGNADHKEEVFLYDRDVGFVQVTESTEFCNWGGCTISGDGRRAAFSSKCDYTGDNPDLNFEVFLLEIESGSITQLTDTQDSYGSFSPQLDDSGSVLVMVSTGDLTGQNPDGSREVFVLDLTEESTTQITDTTDGIWSSTVSGDGSSVLFSHAAAYGPGLSMYRRDDGSTVTLTTGGVGYEADINWDGTRVVVSTRNDVLGSNPDVGYELYLWEAGSGFVQITDTKDPYGAIQSPSINDEGNMAAFVSDLDLVPGQNPLHDSRLFVWNGATGEIIQVTHGDHYRDDYFPAISGGNTSVYFCSDADLVPGGNPTRSLQIFVWECGLFWDSFVTGDTRRWSASSLGAGTIIY